MKENIALKILCICTLFHCSFFSGNANTYISTNTSESDLDAFVSTWKTNNPGTSDSTSITIPADTSNHIYNYDVDWDNDGIFDELGVTGPLTHDFGIVGTYTIGIKGSFPRIHFNNAGDKEKIIDVQQWGTIEWQTFAQAFAGCVNLNFSATDAPDLSEVSSFFSILIGCTAFNSSINHWDVSNVKSFFFAFRSCINFNQPLNNWDMSAATSLNGMFVNCTDFNQALDQWNVSNVTNFGSMFNACHSFNQPINNWDVSSAKHISLMFSEASDFNQDIGDWNVSNVITMTGMFKNASNFNQNIGNWDVSNVENMATTFNGAKEFNQDIGDWNVGNVTNMAWMFTGAKKFNKDIGNWDVSKVTDMTWMFFGANSFNQDIGDWDVGKVISMCNMFRGPDMTFNQDIGDWNVSEVSNMESMFRKNTSFDQNLGNWDVSKLTNANTIFYETKLSMANYDSLLIGWNEHDLQPGLTFDGGFSIYCEGKDARENMINSDGWLFLDTGLEQEAPEALCKDITLYLNDMGILNIDASVLDNGSFDLCTDTVNFSAFQTSFDCSDIGVISNTLTVTDLNGNSNSCISIVTILDHPFDFNCPEDITVNANSLDCQAVVNWDAPRGNCTMTISSSHNSGDVFPLGTTTVTYTATDEFLNTTDCSFNVNVQSDLSINLDDETNPSCFDSQDGQILVSIQGGTGPYTIDWDNDGTGDNDDEEDLSDLGVGSYHVQIIDNLGCTINESFTLGQPDILALSTSIIEGGNGAFEIDLTVNGGMPPYLYDWNIDEAGDYDDPQDIIVDEAGVYLVSVKDSNDCTSSTEVTIVISSLETGCEKNNLRIFPNPNAGIFQLDFENCLENALFEIFDPLGRKVYSGEVSEMQKTISLENLTGSSTYFLKVSSGSSFFIKTFFVLNN